MRHFCCRTFHLHFLIADDFRPCLPCLLRLPIIHSFPINDLPSFDCFFVIIFRNGSAIWRLKHIRRRRYFTRAPSRSNVDFGCDSSSYGFVGKPAFRCRPQLDPADEDQTNWHVKYRPTIRSTHCDDRTDRKSRLFSVQYRSGDDQVAIKR